MEILETGRKNIVVLGAGFGGITALLKLYRRMKKLGLFPDFNLVLINKTSQHLYTPALYEIASLPRGEASALCLKTATCIQIEDILNRFPEIRFLGREVKAMDPLKAIITFKSGEQIRFEYALIALGAETNFFDIPGLKQYSRPLKTFEDAVAIRNRIEEIMHGSSGPIRIVVGGAGATGVELSAEFINFLKYLRSKLAIGEKEDEIVLVEASPEILPGFNPGIIAKARQRLNRCGVKILTGAVIKSAGPGSILLQDGRTLPCHLLIWAGGVKPVSVLKNLGLKLDDKGGVVVNEFLQAMPRIWAIGDCASFINPKTGKILAGNVPIAEAEAKAAAKNIAADITGRKLQPFKPFKNYPFILAVGGKYALTDLVLIKFSGFWGWLLKQLVELRYLLFILPWSKAIKMGLRTIYYSTRND